MGAASDVSIPTTVNADLSRSPICRSTDFRMCNPYSITTNQAAIINLFRVINRYVGIG
jgi:hypothetical protein